MVRDLFGGGAEDLVYFEKQGADRLCGFHCLNNLLQGPLFAVDEVAKVGRDLDAQERRLVRGTDPGYTNVSSDGFFSVSVIEACLARKGFRMKPFGNPEFRDIHTNPAKHGDGFICNQREHWFAVRLIKGRWFGLNSLMAGPEAIAESALSSFLDTLRTSEWSVFVIRPFKWPGEKMPEPDPSMFPQVPVLTSATGSLTRPVFLSFAAAHQLHGGSGGEAATEVKAAPTYSWPTDGGRTISDNARPGDVQGGDDDPDLKAALLASALAFREELPEPPAEVADGIGIRVIDPNGVTITRKFGPTHHVRDIFTWIHKDDRLMPNVFPLLATRDSITLNLVYPKRQLVRELGPTGLIFVHLFPSGEEVSNEDIEKIFPMGETFRLSLS